MRRVVVTGVAGSGKSLFMRMLAEEGVPTWSADAGGNPALRAGPGGLAGAAAALWRTIHSRRPFACGS